MRRSLHERSHHCLSVQLLKILVGLTNTYEDNGLTYFVGHRDRSSNLIIDGIKLGQHNSVYG